MSEGIIIAIIGGVATITAAIIAGIYAIKSKKKMNTINNANNVINQNISKSDNATQIGLQNNYNSNGSNNNE